MQPWKLKTVESKDLVFLVLALVLLLNAVTALTGSLVAVGIVSACLLATGVGWIVLFYQETTGLKKKLAPMIAMGAVIGLGFYWVYRIMSKA